MIIWTTGIIEAEINSAFFQTRKFIQHKLDEIPPSFFVDSLIEKIRIVFVVNRDDISEYHRFSKKEKVLDIRVRVSYEEFRDSSATHQIKMFADALSLSINKINNFQQFNVDKNKLIKLIEDIADVRI